MYSSYVLYKKRTDWKESQQERAKLLFELYPDIEQAYELSQKLSWIFENTKDKLYEDRCKVITILTI